MFLSLEKQWQPLSGWNGKVRKIFQYEREGSDRQMVRYGIPQSCVLGPTQLLIYVNELVRVMRRINLFLSILLSEEFLNLLEKWREDSEKAMVWLKVLFLDHSNPYFFATSFNLLLAVMILYDYGNVIRVKIFSFKESKLAFVEQWEISSHFRSY